MTIAARTALGRSAKSGARTTAVPRTRPDVTSDASWVRAPAASAVADWDRLASTTKPPKIPVARLLAPSATSSWSGSRS